MDTALFSFTNLEGVDLLTWGVIAGSMWIGLVLLVVKAMHGGAKSDQFSRQHFAGQDGAVRTR